LIVLGWVAPVTAQLVPATGAQSVCNQVSDRNAAQLAKVQSREVNGCLLLASRGKLGLPPTFAECLVADGKNKVERSVVKAVGNELKRCAAATLPTFAVPVLAGPYVAPADKRGFDADVHVMFVAPLASASVASQSAFAHDLLGPRADTAVAIKSQASAAAICQTKLLKTAQDCEQAKRKLYTKCKKSEISSGRVRDTAGLVTSCLRSADDFTNDATDAARVARKCDQKLGDGVGRYCGNVALADVFPGPCAGRADFAACLIERVNCRYCQELNATDTLGVDCDLFDDEVANDSCNDVVGFCGDGFLDTATEECDDGNTESGDCCSSSCTLESAGVSCGVGTSDACTQPDTCDGAGTCLPNNAPAGAPCVDDGNQCTDNVCNGDGTCTHPPAEAGSPCGNGSDDSCTDPDSCDGSGACLENNEVAGTSCDDDGEVCTDDVCDESGACEHVANTDPCDDGLFCNGADTCSGGTCSAHAGSECAGADGDGNCVESCNEETDTCDAPDPDGSACADGIVCNGTETCSAGVCGNSSGNPCAGPDNDNNCTESCNENTGLCTGKDPDGSSCNDGVFCNGADTCSNGACIVNAGNPCGGGGECRSGCNEASDSCTDALGTPCSDDGLACTNDFCDGEGQCVHANSAFGQSCPDDGNQCTSDVCNGGGTCIHPARAEGTPCSDDGNVCTTNQCNANGACIGIPNSAPCNDGLFCNGADTCGSGSCSLHAGNPCPNADGDGNCSESCNEVADACTSADPNGSACNNGLNCDGNSDTCQSGSCIPAGVCCGTQTFTFNTSSNNGGVFDSAEWPGGTGTQQSQSGCSVTVKIPSGNIDLVGTLGDKYQVNSFAGFSSCAGSGGSNGVQCLSCPFAGICNVTAERPSCSAALNGSGSARYTVQCVDP